MKALLDGDILAYRCAAASEEADEEICLLRLDRAVREVLYVTESDTYEVFLSGEDNFRYKIFPEYKAHRKDVVKPKWLQQCREYLVTNWNARMAHGCETDDMLGIEQTRHNSAYHSMLLEGQQEGCNQSVICSIDKDLLQIPGKHYNFVKNEFTEVSEFAGLRSFYHQLLMGDMGSDGIPGVVDIGKKKANKFLEGCETEQELFDTCRNIYNNDALMYTYGACLWLWRREGDIWNIDNLIGKDQLDSEEDQQLLSILRVAEEIRQHTVHTMQEEESGFPVDGKQADSTDQTTSPVL